MDANPFTRSVHTAFRCRVSKSIYPPELAIFIVWDVLMLAGHVDRGVVVFDSFHKHHHHRHRHCHYHYQHIQRGTWRL